MRDREELIQQLLNKAWELRRLEDYDSSRAALTSALNLCHKSDHDHLGRIYNIKMQYETDHDHFEKALPYCKTALSFYLQTQNPNKIAHATRHLADIQSELNQLDEAELNYSKAIDIYRYNIQASNGDFANALRGYALLLEKKMCPNEAIELWNEVSELYKAYGIEEGIREANHKISYLKNKI